MPRLRRCWLLALTAASLLTLTAISLLGSSSGGATPTATPTGPTVSVDPKAATLLSQLPATCSGRAPCISFGTPYFSDWSGWMPYVRRWFESSQAACGHSCEVVAGRGEGDAVLFHGRDLQLMPKDLPRSPRQHWVYLNMESPLATARFGYDVASDRKFRYLFNWTATTMLNSPVHQPYGIWDPRQQPLKGPFYDPQKKRHMAYVALSNCKNAFNNRTAKIAHLRQYIDVHVYGACGDKQLPSDWNVWRKISEQYRFYLSFENALCKDYITEKFHNNGLDSQAVPVVIGGLSRDDYERVSPPGSFVYGLDFSSMRALAEHLKLLAADEERYASYFSWKSSYQVSPRTALLCGVCAKLHSDRSQRVFDLSDYYDVRKNCRSQSYVYLP